MRVLPTDFSCTDCALHADPGHKHIVVGEGDENADIMIIDSSPGRMENETGSAFQGDTAMKTFGYLEKVGIPKSVTRFFTYATKCGNCMDAFRTPKSFAFDACLRHLEEEILTIKPKLIISMGAQTAKSCFGQKGTLSESEGLVHDLKIGGHTCKIIYTTRPAAIEKNVNAEGEFLASLRMARDWLFSSGIAQGTPENPAPLAHVGPALEMKIIRTFEEWTAFKAEALALTKIASDIETSGFTPVPLMGGEGGKALLVIGFAVSETRAFCLALHEKYGCFVGDKQKLIRADLKKFLAELKGVTFHNGNFDLFFLKYFGFEVPGCDYDTFLALHILDENAPRGIEAETYRLRPEFGAYWKEQEQYLDKSNGYYNAPLEALCEYCMKDCMVSYSSRLNTEAQLFSVVDGKETMTALGRVFKRITMPLLHNIVESQHEGIQVDLEHVDKLEDKYKLLAEDQVGKLYDALGVEINLGSPQQLAAVLYGKQMIPTYQAGKQTKGTARLIAIAEKTTLELPILKRNKTTDGRPGSPSTDEDTIDLIEKRFRGQYPMLQNILSYREYRKILTTYIGGGQPELVDGKLVESKGKGVRNSVDLQGRVHTTFNLGKTDTYRLSSERPNMQNIPATFEMRRMFVARPGWKIVGGDYSQAELRIMATESQDPGLIKAFEMKQDIHSAVASVLFNKPIEECGKKSEERRRTKAINFGLIYGKGSKALAEDLNISEDEAKGFYAMYFNRFLGVKMWMDRTKDFAHQNGYVVSLFGRTRHLRPEIDNYQEKGKMAHAERQAMNFPIQSAASDCTGIATNRACAARTKAGLRSRFILTVHDEILFESPLEEAEQMAGILQAAAEAPIQGILVPMKMDVAIMDTWAEKG